MNEEVDKPDTNPESEEYRPGLTDKPKKEWPTIKAGSSYDKPIDLIPPGSETHDRLLKHIKSRLYHSETKMKDFHLRWQAAELRMRAYINLVDWENLIKISNDTGEPPKPTNIVVPYTFATVMTIVTYLIHTFTGRRPMFDVGNLKSETQESARYMEMILQYNADHTRLIRAFFQYMLDGETYGLGVLRTRWRTDKSMRTVWKRPLVILPGFGPNKAQPVREERISYDGNDVNNVDPYMFFPDPNVPLVELNRRGEFAFWRAFDSKHMLKLAEHNGAVKYIDDIPKQMPNNVAGNLTDSQRNAKTGTIVDSGGNRIMGNPDYYQIDQGAIYLIPREMGIGDEDYPIMYLGTMANKAQIIQLERMESDHGMLPVSIIEPYSLGYGFGNLSIVDYLSPMQDHMSWLVNSHMDSVRRNLNGLFMVDPTMVEMQDFADPQHGLMVRMKPAAYGRDVRSFLFQLNAQDVTANHMSDFEAMTRIGDTLAAVNDNVRGLHDAGGRKTATEVRTSGEAAASRLASHARLLSAQGMTDLTEQMSVNIQQYQSEEFYMQVVGEAGKITPLRVRPEMVAGDFYYPVHDGTLPIDRVAMVDVWKELFTVVAGNEGLAQQFSLGQIFEHIAKESGAKNIDRFKINPNVQVVPDEQAGDMAASGKMVDLMDFSRQTPVTPGVATGGTQAGGLF